MFVSRFVKGVSKRKQSLMTLQKVRRVKIITVLILFSFEVSK